MALTGFGSGALGVASTGRVRARNLGIQIGQMRPGRWNAITDVPGVKVGHSTIIRGSGKLIVGEGPVRTGVTAIWPQVDVRDKYLPCGYDMPNANGEVTGLLQIEKLGILASPICLTNTSSVGMVYDALLDDMPKDEMMQPAEKMPSFDSVAQAREALAEDKKTALAMLDTGSHQTPFYSRHYRTIE